jgi:hypothetical protein
LEGKRGGREVEDGIGELIEIGSEKMDGTRSNVGADTTVLRARIEWGSAGP